MNRKPLAILLLAAPLLAQKPSPKPLPTDAPTKTLPVTRVSLYKNGVGFFEHTGSVTGNAAVTIDFTSGQLNDVLQSLTAIDLNGGRIAGAGYNSTTPLDQQLKTLPISLAEDATSADFYAAIRGARIEVTGSGAPITGRLLSIEVRNASGPNGGGSDDTKALPERHFLTVVSDTGEVRTLELTPTTSVHLLDTALHTDVSRYLQLLDSNRSQGLRHLTLQDNGTGTRQLQLSYISEVPIWKSTYRILFTDNTGNKSPGGPSIAHSAMGGEPQSPDPTPTATLQGWSVVDNTTGTDWLNVHLSLIAGAPQSFIQPLSDPIYSRRPEIPIAQESQLTPQTHDSSITANDINRLSLEGRSVSQLLKVLPGSAIQSEAAAPMMAMRARGRNDGATLDPAQVNFGGAAGSYSMSGAAVSYEQAANASITPTTTTAAFDDYFSYNLTEPVTILKNTSALVPILQTKLPADRVTLVTYNGNTTSQPLRALWITNSSGLTLDRGSFSIVEDGDFGGEGLLDPIHPGEKRLLSYAADQAIHVTIEGNQTNQHLTSITASKGVIRFHRDELHEITYVVHNAAADTRTVVLEEPVVNGFKLDSEKPGNTDPKPTETTATVYRFRITVAPGDTTRLHSGASRRGTTNYVLSNSDDNQLAFIITEGNHNPALEAALQPILAARRSVSDAQVAVDQTNTRLTALRSDEDRQRANITALANADKSSRDRFVHDLNSTEDAISTAQKELATRTATLDTAKSTLANTIESLQLNIDTP